MSKSTRVASGLGLLGALVAGCVETPDLGSNRDGLSYEQWKATLYREPSGLYVIDGDTPIRDEARLYDIWSAMQAGQLAVYSLGGQDIKWSDTQKLQLTYCVSNAFGANKPAVVAAMQAAAEGGWETFADVNFTYVAAQDANCTNANPNVLFDVNPVNAGGQYLARAFFPDSARADRNVLIDPSSFDPGLDWPLRNIIAHELGHALGFRHEHIRPESGAGQCAEDANFRGLTAYDRASVMHYPQCNGTSADLSFTTVDRQGIAALYGVPAPNPVPMAQFNAPQEGATVPPTFQVRTQIVDSDLARVELWVDGALAETVNASGDAYTFTVTDHAEGPAVLEIKAFDARQQLTQRTVNVTVRAATGGGDENPDTDGDGVADDITGGCSAGGAAGGLPLLGLALGALIRRRRR